MSQVCWLLVGKGGFNQLSFGPHLLCQVQTQIMGQQTFWQDGRFVRTTNRRFVMLLIKRGPKY